ncbi:MAG TPA: DinB family protein [Flavipsychrobacter sp.]|nr:DinB family protein [Flavipsychrobacter sp.]
MTPNKQETFVVMVMNAWNARINQLDKLLSELSDEQLLKEVAPGRNRGAYLLGHLTAVNNAMLPLLGFGNEIAPHLSKTFIQTSDKDIHDLPPVNELRQEWTNVKKELANQFAKMQPDDWFQKHNSVSEEDFAKEPHRNKLNVVIGRTNHLDYHTGQLVLLKTK